MRRVPECPAAVGTAESVRSVRRGTGRIGHRAGASAAAVDRAKDAVGS